MKIHSKFIICMVIIQFIASTCALDVKYLTNEAETKYPLIVEYIPNFHVGSSDLDKLIHSQFQQITIADVKTAYVALKTNSVSTSYKGTSKKVQYQSPIKVKVTNDSFILAMSFNVRVLHIVGGKNYTCSTSIPEIFLNYTKEVDFSTGNTIVSNLSYSFTSQSFKPAVCKQKQSAKDQVRIDEAINATEGSSVYIELKKVFNKIPQYFNLNAKDQHLSLAYDTNPYVYDYYTYKTSIDVSTIKATTYGQNGIINEISGLIAGTSHSAVAPPPYEGNYTTFYSSQFIRNMIEYAGQTYPGWKNMKFNSSNIRSRIFKFRLVDFQFIVPTILQQFPKYYLTDVEIQCSIQNVGDFSIDQKGVNQQIKWRCLGGFESSPGKKQIFLNFVIQLSYGLLIRVTSSKYLSVLNEVVLLSNLSFDYVGIHQVIDPFTVAEYINEILFQFRTYTIGTFFKVNAPNNQIKFVASGMWIG